MNRYLFRVQYDYADGMTPIAGVTSSYEAVCIRAATEAAALTEVETATDRYQIAAAVTRTITLTLTTADV
jgi:hypothetical protein